MKINQPNGINDSLQVFQNFVGTYHTQAGWEEYNDTTYIEDMLYGLAISLNPKYKFANGFRVFKYDLIKYLSAQDDVMTLDTVIKATVYGGPEQITALQVGNPVRIIKKSVKYNPNINNVGYIGIIDEILPSGYNIQCIEPHNSYGAVDADAVVYYYDTYLHAGYPGLVR